MKKSVQIVMLFLVFILLSGCKGNYMDDYSFGTQTFTYKDSAIEVFMPFQIQELKKTSPLKEAEFLRPDDALYAGSDKNITVFVEAINGSLKGKKPVEGPYDELKWDVEQTVKRYRSNQNISVTDAKLEPTMIGNTQAIIVHITYTFQGKGYEMTQYSFVSKGTIWNVRYENLKDNEESEQLVKYVKGKIKILS